MADRYPSDPGDPMKALEERLRLLEAKVEEQNRRNPLNNGVFSGTLRNVDASGNTLLELDGNGMKVYDADGVLLLSLTQTGLRMYDELAQTRAFIGQIAAGNYGLRVRDADNGIRFSVENDGYKDPWLTSPMISAGALTNITSASFVPVYQGHVMVVSHMGMGMTAVVNTDVGTTAEFRVKNTDTGATTSAVSVPSGGSVGQDFQWLHGSDLGGGPVRFDLEARRTGGAGNVIVFQPYSLSMIDPDQCSATGL